jgi:protein SCO1/2
MSRAVAAPVLLLAALLSNAASGAVAIPSFAPRLGTQLDTSLVFRDEAGRSGPLQQFLHDKPALLLFGYDRCPGLCGVAEVDLADALQKTGLGADRYRVIFASIDPEETPTDALAAREKLGAAVPAANLAGWSFLTGGSGSVSTLDRAAGLDVTALPGRTLYVHPVATLALTPGGRIARAFGGIDYAARDLRLALVEAAEGKLGSLSDRLTVLCSSFDPSTGRYTSAVMVGVRLAAVATLAVMAIVLLRLRRKGATS